MFIVRYESENVNVYIGKPDTLKWEPENQWARKPMGIPKQDHFTSGQRMA